MAGPGQGSFLEAFASTKLGRNGVLERVEGAVRWYRFEKLLRRLRPEGAGRPPYDGLLMFKALLLQQWYALSDAELEEALNDRVSFRRFLGLGLEDDAPDHTTLCRFRNRLIEAGLAEKLFAEFDKQMEERGLMLKKGTMLDATLVAAASARPPLGTDPQDTTDPDARFAARQGKSGSTYGYKAHIGVDCGTRLIRTAKLTSGNVNDTVVADDLIRFDEAAVYADKAYAKTARRAMLRAMGIKDRIMHKSWGGGPALSPWQTRHNKLISPIRAEVETVFAVVKRRMGYTRVRYRGLIKNAAHFFILAIAYNMRRAAALTP
jgi:IS5 family transposase